MQYESAENWIDHMVSNALENYYGWEIIIKWDKEICHT